ncbi:Major facilitator superfamily domain-containing protein 12 [Stylophora pistillata]|uniref:Major facilitator superfamily domain-containing protein 12 n=2 Tax=Stylophora pistillata TaxID=50429 RepID=A0A2B4S4C3_STYPI|nr:Major facilitator superfamily domain-containing protein 12 [Stylophora pistillata]
MATCLMAISIPLLLNRCLLCDARGQTWLPILYYSFLSALKGFSYNMVEINHLAFITAVAENVEEATTLSAMRTAFTFLSGVYVYVLAWVLLEQDSADSLGPKDYNVFAKISWIATGTGLFFAAIFYTGPKEPQKRLRKRNAHLDLTNVPGVFSPLSGGVQNSRKTSLSHLFVDKIMTSSSFEPIEHEGSNVTPNRPSHDRRRTVMQRFLHALLCEGESNTGQNQLEHHDTAKTIEISRDLDIVTCLAARVKLDPDDGNLSKLENDRSKVSDHVDQSTSNSVNENGNHEEALEDLEIDDAENGHADEDQGVYQEDQTREIAKNSVLDKPKVGRHGVVSVPDENKYKFLNLAFDDDKREVKADSGISDTSAGHSRMKKNCVAFKLLESPLVNEKQLELNSHESNKTQNTFSFQRSQDHLETSETENRGFEPREEIKLNIEEYGEVPDLSFPCKTQYESRSPKALKDWLKDANLYKVAAIFTFSRLAQGPVYAYLALYLIEKLHFPKEASAYFPLVLLMSASSSSFICGKLNRKIGNKWNYVLAGTFVMAGTVWIYFQTPPTRQLTYGPVAMIGSGLSVMYVMALAFIAKLLGEDKERSGSVISIINVFGSVSMGSLSFLLQLLYPDKRTSSKEEIGNYVKDAFAVTCGIMTLMGVLVVLLFQPSKFTCKSKARIHVEAAADQCVSQQNTSKPSVNPDKTQNSVLAAMSSCTYDTRL